MRNIALRDRLVFALDVPIVQALKLIETSGSEVGWVKMNYVFLEAYTLLAETGIDIFALIKKTGAKIWLDLKWKDIPRTVAGYVAASKGLGVDMFNMHATGSMEMMKAAVAEANKQYQDNPDAMPLKIAISILTSINQEVLNDELNTPGTVVEEVRRLALNAKRSGMDGIVSSMHETGMIKAVCGADFLVLNPAIRFEEELEADKQDQKRLGTPANAIINGADMIVMGNSLIKGGVSAVRRAYAEIEAGLEQRADGIATVS